jgi:hypothetical protein
MNSDMGIVCLNIGMQTIQIAAFLETFPFIGFDARESMTTDSLLWVVKEVFRSTTPKTIAICIATVGFEQEVCCIRVFLILNLISYFLDILKSRTKKKAVSLKERCFFS